jgi:hypothetical protein
LTPASLLAEIESYADEPRSAEKSAMLERTFGERARAIGARPLFVHLFRTYGGSMLGVWLRTLQFAWKDVPFATWRAILEDIAGEPLAVYHFLWFAAESLALDIHRLGVAHPIVERHLARDPFDDGGPHPITRYERERMEDTFDYDAVWRRLAEEGAPMRTVPPGARDRHKIVF